MKAVMYHYVREHDPVLPNFRFLDIRNFRKQLDYFDKNFGFVTKDEWNRFIQTGIFPVKSGKVVLTFDDAMSCHYKHVYPELVRRNLWGIFYVPTLPYTSGKLLDVHRIQLLCGAFTGKDLFEEARRRVTSDMIPDAKKREFQDQTYISQENFEGVSEFKRLLNYFISYDYRESVIDELSATFSYTYDPTQFYVQNEQLKEMKRGGMIIGSHTVDHPVMSKLHKAAQAEQITSSFQTLKHFGLLDSKTYCHPYGGFHSFNDNTVSILNDERVQYSFNVEAREIAPEDFVNALQFLPRFDCNLFEHGTAS